MHRLRSLPLAAALLVLAAVPGNAANRGISHLIGDTEGTALTPAGDVDIFVFDLPRGTSLSITLKAGKGVALFPALTLVRPDGTTVAPEALAAAKYAPGRTSVKVSNFPVDQTGRWAAWVSAWQAGQTGAFTFQTKAKYPASHSAKGVVVPSGGNLDIPVPLAGGTILAFSLKRKSGGTGFTSVPTLLDGAAVTVPVAAASWALSETSVTAKAIPIPPRALGDFTLRVPGPSAGGDAVADWSVKVKWPKRKGVLRAISSNEPSITTVSPNEGNLGTTIAVIGTNISEGAVFEVGGRIAGSITRNLQGTTLSGTAPTGSGTADVALYNADGQVAIRTAAFTYVPAPTVGSITPNRGPATGGTAVTIRGTGFRTGARVLFNGFQVLGGATVVDSTTITATTEPLPSGVYSVQVRDVTNLSGTLAGSFTFDRLMTSKTDSLPSSVAASVRALLGLLADLDNDAVGNDDLVLSTATLTSDGSGGYLPATRVLRGANNGTFADLTGQTFNNSVPSPSDFFPNIASYTPPVANPSRKDYGLAEASAMGDLDGDGNDDLVLSVNGFFGRVNGWQVTVNGYTYPVEYPGTRVFRNLGNGAFQNTSMTVNASNQVLMAMPVLWNGLFAGEYFQARANALGDLDGDGDLDLLLSTDDRFRAVQFQYDTTLMNWYPVTINAPALRILANDGTGSFRLDSKFFISGWLTSTAYGEENFQAAAIATADVDSDGKRDIVIANDTAPVVSSAPVFATRVLLSTGTAFTLSANALPAASALDDGRATALVVVDVTGDGRPDILVATPDALETVDQETGAVTRKSSTRLFGNNGGGTFLDVTGTRLPAPTAVERLRGHSLKVVDIDRDGDVDLLVTYDGTLSDGSGGYLSSTRLLLNNGSGTFTPAPAGFFPAVDLDAPSNAAPRFHAGRWVAASDLDGDGDAEIVLGTDVPVTGVPAAGSRAPAVEVILNR